MIRSHDFITDPDPEKSQILYGPGSATLVTSVVDPVESGCVWADPNLKFFISN